MVWINIRILHWNKQHMFYLQVILGESLLSSLGLAVPGCTSEMNTNKNNFLNRVLIVYADDINLLNHSITGLHKLVDTCSEFGLHYSLTLNESKTVCLKCSHCGDLTVAVVRLNGQKLKWEANVKHVGNIITSTLDDKDNIELKIREYFCQVNKLLSYFQGLRHDVLSELFIKYCNSSLWKSSLGP